MATILLGHWPWTEVMATVVIGGGIIGVACAYYLARRGEPVTLVERGALGMGSTGRSAGGIRKQFSTAINVELSLRSGEVWASFDEEFGVDIGYQQHGYLYLARETSTLEALERAVSLQRDHGIETRLMTPSEAAEVCPGLRTDRFLGATYLATDGFADPYLAVQGYAMAARDLGVELRTKTAVTDVLTSGGRVHGIETEDGKIEADTVVNTTGGWLAQVTAMAGVDLPVSPRRRQVAVVAPEHPLDSGVPLTIDHDTGVYFRPEGDDLAIVGGHLSSDDPAVDPDAYRTDYDLEWALDVLDIAGDVATYFGRDTELRDGWAGLYAVTPDHHPIIDEVIPGFVVAGGFSGHGFQHAPATGQLVAELILEEPVTSVNIDRLGLERFEEGETEVERNVT